MKQKHGKDATSTKTKNKQVEGRRDLRKQRNKRKKTNGGNIEKTEEFITKKKKHSKTTKNA